MIMENVWKSRSAFAGETFARSGICVNKKEAVAKVELLV